MSAGPDLKATLNLPHTEFPMKANLPQNEPKRLATWEESQLYAQIRAARKGAPIYLLHDGPPYANGPIHLGHAMNKCLKDFVVKSKTMAGFDSPYVPGWDCHGLPIEIKVDEQLGRKKLEIAPIEVLRACREYAAKYVDLQRTQFIRLGVFGEFDHPYSTMSKSYEARVLETFFEFLEAGFVYKGLKPVYWCIHDRTALAEAEVEYEMHTSPSIYVRYKLTSDPAALDPALKGKQVSTIIWTTTPWTLPASLAVAFHPEFEYAALESGDDVFIVAESLANSVAEGCGLKNVREIARFPGRKLERATFQHPFLDRSILGVLAEYVTADQGTGAVHTAPAHGADDFYTGVRYGLDPTCNVDGAGRLHHGLPEYDGKKIFAANEPIIELLKARGALLARLNIEHSYPHCWRCHNPVIFRATEQWFIGMETPMENPDGSAATFRTRALDEIKKVRWDPSWGEERISNMIATRPDWCISRQRIWGVPIAVFLCEKCNQPLRDPAIFRRVVELFEEEGADAWHTHSTEDILPPGTVCQTQGCGSDRFTKEMDILDVWFDSGTSQAAVLGDKAGFGLTWPADLYLEGGDQHRGWFHTSLLLSVGTKNAAPYRRVATCGWTLDEQGRALSKSRGNFIDPGEVGDQLGADIIRLWVASVDFREDVVATMPLLKRLAEDIYRKLRNTFRFLLGNLGDFNPASDALPFEQLLPLDQYMLVRTAELTAKVLRWYEEMEFHRVYHAINEFCTADLSAMYLDLLKDRMYTFAPNDPARRSAQTAVWRITEALVRLTAPYLSFTAEEVWQYLPTVKESRELSVHHALFPRQHYPGPPTKNGREPSVHLALFPRPQDLAPPSATELLPDWKQLLGVRDDVLKSLEEARKEKRIGKALEAKVRLEVPAGLAPLIEKYQSSLKELFNVSQVELTPAPEQNGSSTLRVTTLPADGTKCERCWNYSVHVGESKKWPTVCERCVAALEAIGAAPTADAVTAAAGTTMDMR
ncbi:MAG TPA: isoleucine--tRNA ligase [Acidobacteriaceae bacterium]|nr:isoleucine--tRNA ligase [Acidobacteriaceae bacterium]